MNKYYVSKRYADKTARPLAEFALKVASALRDNPYFSSPPITASQLTELAKDVSSSSAVLAALDFLASYVERVAGNDLSKMQSSGFDIFNAAEVAAGPAPSAILSATNVDLGRLGLELRPSPTAWAYLVEYQALPNGVKKYAMSSELTGLSLPGLTPGAAYAMRVMVMDSRVHKSEWSETVEYLVG